MPDSNEVQLRVEKLPDTLKTIHDELQSKFDNAWITDSVWVRIATILDNDETTGRFLNANSNLSVDILKELHTGLWAPDPINVVPYKTNLVWVHSDSTWEN